MVLESHIQKSRLNILSLILNSQLIQVPQPVTSAHSQGTHSPLQPIEAGMLTANLHLFFLPLKFTPQSHP